MQNNLQKKGTNTWSGNKGQIIHFLFLAAINLKAFIDSKTLTQVQLL